MPVRQIAEAADAGKLVLSGKPLAFTRSEAGASLASRQAAKVRVRSGHECRVEPATAETRSLVSTGALGTIMHSDANFRHDKLVGVPAINWRSSPNDVLAAGMFAMGVYLTDAFIDRLGPFDEVFASVTSRATFPDNGDVDSAHLRFGSDPPRKRM